VASLLFLVVSAFVLFNKVYSPQFVVWLVPLAALAWPRWRDFLAWQLVEALYVLAVAGHMAATAYLVYRVARSVWDPGTDPVRRVGQEDPQAGPFAGAERDPLPRLPWIGRPLRHDGSEPLHQTVDPSSSAAP